VFLNELNRNVDNRMRIEIVIGGVKVKALIDLYAERSVLCVNVFRKIQYQPKPLCNDVILLTASGELPMYGKFVVPYLFKGSTFQQNFVIAGGIAVDCILGSDAIFDLGLIIDSVGRAVFRKVSKVPSTVFQEVEEQLAEPASVAILEQASVPVNSVVMVQCKAPQNTGSLGDSNQTFEPSSNLPAGNVSKCCYPSNVRKETSISESSMSSKSIFRPRESVVAVMEVKPCNSPMKSKRDAIACSFGSNVEKVVESHVEHSPRTISPHSKVENLTEVKVNNLKELCNEHCEVSHQSQSELDTLPSNIHVMYEVKEVLKSKEILKIPPDPGERPLKLVPPPTKTDPPDKDPVINSMPNQDNPALSTFLTSSHPFDPGDPIVKHFGDSE
jgi:hypothetical protein